MGRIIRKAPETDISGALFAELRQWGRLVAVWTWLLPDILSPMSVANSKRCLTVHFAGGTGCRMYRVKVM